MPLLNITTNQPCPPELGPVATTIVAEMLGKPERYVMVSISAESTLVFSGSDQPCAYLELKSIGLPGDRTRQYSQALCELMEQRLGIPQDRVYIEFTDAPRDHWGWNGGTF